MIVSFRHRRLERLYRTGDRRRFPPEFLSRTERILARLDVATQPEHMDLPGYRLHPLRGDLADHWSVRVSANWRITFRFEGEDVRDVDLTDYH